LSIVGLIVLIVVGGILINLMGDNTDPQYQFAEVTYGNLESTISSSGTLSPVTIVEVGTQVSGTIAKVYVDFNDQVNKGNLLAVLDTVLLKAGVLEAEAGVDKAKAELDEAQIEEHRNLPLFNKNLISESEYLQLQTKTKIQRAILKSARASLKRAKQNLKYAVIRSPINGRVITKNVETGQTVASNFSTPTLFEIAEDLTLMEILVAVDESDIGLVKEGQKVIFEVQAYDDKEFEGTVKQIRLKPKTISNVVNYTVVVEAENKEQFLLPGMTAVVDFIIDQRINVLLVPKGALRFQASEKEFRQFQKRKQKEFQSLPESDRKRLKNENKNRSSKPDNAGLVWFINEDGNMEAERVLTGFSNGKFTEIVKSRQLEEGMQIISARLKSSSKKTSKTQVFQSTRSGGPAGR